MAEGLLSKADRLGRFIENAFLTLLLLGMMTLAAAQIFLRWGGAGSLAWGDEAVRLMVLWIALVAGVAAAREDRHISIDVLSRFLAPRPKAFVALFVDLFAAGVAFVLARYSYTMVGFALEDGEVLLGGLPAWWFQIILPVGFALIGYRYLIWFGRRLLIALGAGGDK